MKTLFRSFLAASVALSALAGAAHAEGSMTIAAQKLSFGAGASAESFTGLSTNLKADTDFGAYYELDIASGDSNGTSVRFGEIELGYNFKDMAGPVVAHRSVSIGTGATNTDTTLVGVGGKYAVSDALMLKGKALTDVDNLVDDYALSVTAGYDVMDNLGVSAELMHEKTQTNGIYNGLEVGARYDLNDKMYVDGKASYANFDGQDRRGLIAGLGFKF